MWRLFRNAPRMFALGLLDAEKRNPPRSGWTCPWGREDQRQGGQDPAPREGSGDTPASPGPAAAVREPLGLWQRHSGLGLASPRPALGPPRCARSRVPLNFLWRSPNTGTASGGGALGGDGG